MPCVLDDDVCLIVVQEYRLGVIILLIPGIEHYSCAPPDVQEQWKTQRSHMLSRDNAGAN
jgi:hypothetical protein